MRGVFNPDSPMMRALGVVWDLIVLNLLFLVCCIPVVTIGPAITALHYVTTKMAGEKDGTPVVGNFFKSFRANFRQGVLMGILFGAAEAHRLWLNQLLNGLPSLKRSTSSPSLGHQRSDKMP